MFERVVGKASNTSCSVGIALPKPRYGNEPPPSSLHLEPAAKALISANVRSRIAPLPFVVPSTVGSCLTTRCPSLVAWISYSRILQPMFKARSNAYIVFGGQSPCPPRWAIVCVPGWSKYGWAAMGCERRFNNRQPLAVSRRLLVRPRLVFGRTMCMAPFSKRTKD